MIKGVGMNGGLRKIICTALAAVMLCMSVDVSVFAADENILNEVASDSSITEELTEVNSHDESLINEENTNEDNLTQETPITDDLFQKTLDRENSDALIENDGIESENPFAGGNGTKDDPYLISSVSQMESLPSSKTDSLLFYYYETHYYKLTTDLVLDNWKTINIPSGSFDGGGHTIYNLKVVDGFQNGHTHGAALFCDIREIKNLTIENAEVSTDNMSYYKYDYSPSVFATNVNNIENCCLKGTVLLKGSGYSGGFASKVEKTIKNCENYAQITVQKRDEESLIHFGGFASSVNGEAENLINQEGSSIDAEGETGGIAVRANSLKNCKNYADISVGDVIYKGQKSILSASGIVLHAGSIYADKPFTISNCDNFGNIIASYGQAAGISIEISGGSKGNSITVKNCSNEGNISSQYDYGKCAGIAVELNSYVRLEGCNNKGTIAGNKIGGVAYEASSKGVMTSSCYNKGELRLCYSDGVAGGIIGVSSGGSYGDGEKNVEKLCIENSYNCGKVARNNTNSVTVGGIIANLYMASHLGDMPEGKYIIRNCYNNVSFTGFKDNIDHVAGMIGYYSYSRTDYVNYGCEVETENCYCLDRGYSYIPTYIDEQNNSLKSDNEYVSEAFSGFKQCTDAEMRRQSTYKGFDFDSVWEMGEGDYPYPILVEKRKTGYKIVLDANGGLFSDGQTVTEVYTTINGNLFTSKRPIKEGNFFRGWYTEAKGGEKVNNEFRFSEDSTVFAHWGTIDASKQVTVSPNYPQNGATGISFMNLQVEKSIPEFSLTFSTSEMIKGADFSSGQLVIRRYDDDRIIYTSDANVLAMVDASGFKVDVYLGKGADNFDYHTKYYVELMADCLTFEDTNQYVMLSDKTIWSFQTGSVVKYRDEQNKKNDVILPYWYDPEGLDFDKPSTEFDWDIAMFSYGLALSAFQSYKGDSMGYANAKWTLENMGFDSISWNEGFEKTPSMDSIGVIAAKKKIQAKGKEYTLIVLLIRGAGYGAEWSSNAKVDISNYHQGFEDAAKLAISHLRSYILANLSNYKGDIKILTTGYSRAGGTANVIAFHLDKDALNDIPGVRLSHDDIYGYCFEPPMVTTRTDADNLETYGNIYCLINDKDIVTKVPSSSWEFKHFGKELYYPSSPTGFWNSYREKYPLFRQNYLVLSGLRYNETQFEATCGPNESRQMKDWLDLFVNTLCNKIKQEDFVKDVQPILRNALQYGLDMSKAKDLAVSDIYLKTGVNSDDKEVTALAKIILYALMENRRELEGAATFLVLFSNQLRDRPWIETPYSDLVDSIKDWKAIKAGAINLYDMFDPQNGNSNADLIMQEHFPLVNFAWLMACSDGNFVDAGRQRYIYVKCPVNVSLYDRKTNELAAKIIGNEPEKIEGSSVIAYVDGNGQKVFAIPLDMDYRVEIIGTDDGMVNYSVVEKQSGEVIKRIDYLDVPVNKGEVIEGTVMDQSAELKKENVALTPNIQDINNNSATWYTLELLADNNEMVLGSGTYMKNEYLTVKAFPNEGEEFEAWYEGDKLVSKDPEYHFRINKDIVLSAKFIEIDGIWISPIEPQTYTGVALTPDIMLYDGAQQLSPGTDYTVTYKNNKNAYTFEDVDKLTDEQKKKAPQAIIKMKGNYSGQEVVYFCINPLSVDDEAAFEASVKKGKKTVIFKYNDKVLKEKTDYTVDSVTDAAVTVTGKGNFTGTHEFTLAVTEGITNVSMSKVTVEAIPTQFYTGTALTAGTFKGSDGSSPYAIKVSYPKGTELTAGKDYVVAGINNSVNVGTATIVLKGLKAGGTAGASEKYSFTGEKRIKVKIAPRPMDSAVVTGSDGSETLSAVYSKAGAKPENLTVTVEGRTLKEGRDYTVKYSGNTKYSGTGDKSDSDGKLTVAGKGNYKGSKSFMFKITRRPFTENSGINVNVADMPYSDKAGKFMSGVKVYDSEGKLLKAGTDYEKEIRYEAADGTELNKTSTPGEGDVITVKVTGKGGYTNDTISATYKILKAGEVNDISKAKISIDPVAYRSGKVILTGDDASHVHASIGKDKKILTFSTDGVDGDFMVLPGSYENNDKKGTAKVTFVGINNYSGSKTVTVKIGARSLLDWWKGLFM